MYAVIETGGKQYRVEVGTELTVELLDAAPGDEITLDRVLLVADGDEAAVGRPVVEGATVSATVLRSDRAAKVISFKYKPKARRRVKKGHRQEQTVLRITDVVLDGRSAAAAVREAAEAKKTERQRLEQAAAEQAAADAVLAATLAQKAAVIEPPKKARRRAAKAEAVEQPTDAGRAPIADAEQPVADDVPAAEDGDAPAADAEQPAADVPAKPRRTRTPKKED